ncbi:MAG: response regulator [Oscillospiraceae bacterium]|nr:response regulator [Oscillospiraceae bacterium]
MDASRQPKNTPAAPNKLKDLSKRGADRASADELRENERLMLEIKRRDCMMTALSDAAGVLLQSKNENHENNLRLCMGMLGNAAGADRVQLWKNHEADGKLYCTQIIEWLSNASSQINLTHTVDLPYDEAIPGWREILSGGKCINSAVKDLSPKERSQLELQDILSVFIAPIFVRERFWGMIGFDDCHSERLLSESDRAILLSGGIMLANAVERNEVLHQVAGRLAQQQLMADISKSFISKEPMGDMIRKALARMGAFLNVVRVLVAVFEKNSEISRPEYVWFSDPKYTPNASQKGFSGIIRELFPRFREDGKEVPIIYCDNVLTHEDGIFEIFHERGGLMSFICAPIYVNDDLWGVMSIEEHEKFRAWSESDAMLVGMVSSAISSAVARDIMEKERDAALEQAVRSGHAKGDFLSNMSHEIRTPLNAIIGMTQIGMSSSTVERKDYSFSRIDDASKHLLGVVNDILDFSKIEAGKFELSLTEFDFEKMLQKTINVIGFRADERRQRIYVNIDNDVPRSLIGDDQRLSQIITNLLSNAVKFTPEEGVIRIDCILLSEEDDMCRLQISVTDNDIGITEEQKSRLFNSFEQAEAGTARKFGGTGLGLAISKRIVEMMDGEIWAQSEAGHGATFTFNVLLKRDVKARVLRLAEGINWSNIRVFAVDDEAEVREFFTNMSKHLGICCTAASSGEEALEMLETDPEHDVYFLDLRLPGMNGIELARRIREKDEARTSVAILFSAVDRSDAEDEAKAAGVDKFLQKPLFASDIIDLINGFLGVQRDPDADKKKEETFDFSGHTILLAEDVEINREIVSALLEPTGLTVECAENGAQALEMFKAAPDKYEMIFMDVQMPEMDGYEATRSIRALDIPGADDIPIIAMTANVFRQDIEKCLEAGMNGHVGKPVDTNVMLTQLRRYLYVSDRRIKSDRRMKEERRLASERRLGERRKD